MCEGDCLWVVQLWQSRTIPKEVVVPLFISSTNIATPLVTPLHYYSELTSTDRNDSLTVRQLRGAQLGS